ncbi:MAG: glycosyltransferase, partial [Acidimicrobiia bacterium]|nr:glycosyltransferase [Acidimicrobiia bacterium]
MLEAIASAYLIVGFAYLVGTVVLSRSKKRIRRLGDDPKVFVFVVPALNEAAVIAPTVESLLVACGRRGRILVVDDGSSDDTAAIVESFGDRRILVLRRRPP